MDKAESQLFPADGRQNLLVAKRTAFEDLDPAPDAKRIKDVHDVSTEPDVKTPAITRRVSFPEKVC